MPNPQHRIARAAGVVMAAFVLSNIAGLARQILIARAFGASLELDAYYAAIRLPDILFTLVAGGALGSAFIPLFSGFLARDDRAGAWRLASGVTTLVFLTLTIVGGLAAILAPLIVSRILAPGFSPAAQALTVSLLRLMLASSVIFGVSGLVMGIHNAHQHFLLPAIAPILYNVGIMIGALAAPVFGVRGLAYGVVFGALMHLVVQLPGLRGRGARYTPTLGLDNPAVRDVAKLMGPRVLGLAVVQLNFLINIILASGMPEGSLSGLTVAFQILTLPEAVIAQAIAIAALPTFADQFARGQLVELRAALAGTLRGILFLSVPSSIGLLILRKPIVVLLFQRGHFDERSTELVAWALAFYAIGLVGHSVVEIVSRAFYALHNTRTPVAIGAAAMTLNVILSLLFSRLFAANGLSPHGGLALANSIATALEMIGLLWLIARRLGGLEARAVTFSLARTLGGGAAMTIALLAWLNFVASRPAWLVGLGGTAIGGVIFWLVAALVGSEEARAIPKMAVARLRL
ncbi:MAG: murein biosynthesis integral membrane protein MurJ [Chloroflexi bacterium]|nr:murein biosynthesis integral membrane protein MurJ [Chloroflexota bacterium]